VHIRHSKIAVEEQSAMALLSERDRKVHRDRRFAHAALATAHRKEARPAQHPVQLHSHRRDWLAFDEKTLVQPEQNVVASSSNSRIRRASQQVVKRLLEVLKPGGLYVSEWIRHFGNQSKSLTGVLENP
jgi:hypothetical protein